jgi:hypothetical protein
MRLWFWRNRLIGRFITLMALTIGIASCGHAKVSLSLADQQLSAGSYSGALDRWTRSERVYENVESRLFVSATLLSWEFRQSQIAYRTERERLAGVDVDKLTSSNRKEAAQWVEFFVAAHTHEWRWNRLENRSKDAIWRLRLINDKGVVLSPETINRLGSDDPRYRALYPAYKDFYVGYRVRFPLKDSAGKEIAGKGVSELTLRVSGAPAVVNLSWKLVQ